MGPQMGKPVTDFAGQTRFLRALCAAVPFNSITPSDHPKTDEILKICETLWSALFHREMLDDLKAPEASKTERHRFGMAALTSLLSVVQQDLIYVEQAGERVRRNFGPFSKDIIEPAIGLGVEDVLKGFEQVRTTLEERYNSAIENMQPARESYDKWCRRYDAGASAQETKCVQRCPGSCRSRKAVAIGLSQLGANPSLHTARLGTSSWRTKQSVFERLLLRAGRGQYGNRLTDIRRRRPQTAVCQLRGRVLCTVGYSLLFACPTPAAA